MRKLHFIFVVFLIVTPYDTGYAMERYVEKFFKSQYHDPLINKGIDASLNKFPKLKFYSVIEKERLVEDPAFPDNWVVTSKKNFFRIHDLDKALAEEKIAPRDKREALQYAVSFIIIKLGSYYWVNDQKDFYAYIPQRYFTEAYFPKVTKQNNAYNISVCFYYPQTRYPGFMHGYQDTLVRHEMVIDGFNYNLKNSVVMTTDLEKMELELNNLIYIKRS